MMFDRALGYRSMLVVSFEDSMRLSIIEKIPNVLLPMPVSTEAIKQDIDRLTHNQLQQVADFIAFLNFRHQRDRRNILDRSQLADLFTEFADEDRALAEAGMNDYAIMLDREDQA